MPALDHSRRWTREEVLALPDDGNRYELVDGELLVSPSPTCDHQRAVRELVRVLLPYTAANPVGELFFAPLDVDLKADQLLQPDVFVIAPTGGTPPRGPAVAVTPILVVEVLSDSTAEFDRVTKRARYQRAGVPTYWVVDLDARAVEAWTPDADRPAIVVDTLKWEPVAGTAPFVLDLRAYFPAVLDAG
jgi:Uma2 family endonuclease